MRIHPEHKKKDVWDKIQSLGSKSRREIWDTLEELEDAFPWWGWIAVGIGTAVGLAAGFVIGLLYMGAF